MGFFLGRHAAFGGEAMTRERLFEGVPYHRYRVEFTTESGERCRLFHWSPGLPWLREEVTRMLNDRGDVAAGSDVIVAREDEP